MDNLDLARIIAANSRTFTIGFPGSQETFPFAGHYLNAEELNDTLADAIEAEVKEQCPVIYAGGFCFVHKVWDRAEWTRVAKGEPDPDDQTDLEFFKSHGVRR